MKSDPAGLRISPTDLARFLSCRHRTALELAEAGGGRERPKWDDPLLEALFALGLEHERHYVARLESEAGTFVNLGGLEDRDEAVAATLDAMRAGADVIVQAALANGRWYGLVDILRRVPRPSPVLGDWSYEVADTKLARDTRGGTILQLGLYCEMLEAAQGVAPEKFYVVTPGGSDGAGAAAQLVREYRVHDFAAYFRLLKARLERAVAEDAIVLAAENYPEPVDHCDICPWSPVCRDKRRKDDHLSLVAGISRLQRRELAPFGITTVEALGGLPEPLPFEPARGAIETYTRVRDQARLQVQSRREGRILYELISPKRSQPESEAAKAEPIGLARLPKPSPGDLFLDLEGDALAGGAMAGPGQGGREYLFGLVDVADDGEARYRKWWADDPQAERLAFEAVIDLITSRLERCPDLHVYHYAPYEPAALKRLMGRYATRERELDELLRGRRFVDLYAVVRQGIRAGVERYSIKNIEPLYGFLRDVDLRVANQALRVMEQALEFDRVDLATEDVRQIVEGYNRDDCVSTLRLRDWLEARRADLIDAGTAIDRPPVVPGEASEDLDQKAQRVEALRERLLGLGRGMPDDPAERTPGEHARYQLAYLLDWHRREDKAGWWEYFRLCELPEDDLLEEPKAVAGLEFVGEIKKVKRSYMHRYKYPLQLIELKPGDKLNAPTDGEKLADLVAIDRVERTIDLKVGPTKRHERPTALFEYDYVGAGAIEQALFDLGQRVADAGGVEALPPCPERALLLREPPSLTSGALVSAPRAPGRSVTDQAVDITTTLNRTTLAIQGPPGSGKTFTGARMIVEAVRAGLKVGVTANSHKVIRNLLDAVRCSPGASGPEAVIRLGHKAGDDDEGEASGAEAVTEFADNAGALAAIAGGAVNVLGGTAWLWARPEFAASVDILFVDEAGQMSLANVLGVARAASSLVLLGDPQQLEQPSKGSHPDGVGLSALQHVLGDAQTMPEGRGLFLPITWRLAPAICAFTSELFYAGQLYPKPGLEHQRLAGNGRFDGAGLWLIPVEHDGNRNASDEEAAEVARIVQGLLSPGSEWVDETGASHRMTVDDLRVVAPFNAHVQRIRDALEAAGIVGAHIGTVDKFQGQEAPAVIYSMATSRPEDAPRGLEFLYSLNRFNVATSRARCAVILVASPYLFEPECRTPRQMHLANALCRFRELAVGQGA